MNETSGDMRTPAHTLKTHTPRLSLQPTTTFFLMDMKLGPPITTWCQGRDSFQPIVFIGIYNNATKCFINSIIMWRVRDLMSITTNMTQPPYSNENIISVLLNYRVKVNVKAVI